MYILEMHIYVSKIFSRWKLPSGTNDDVSNATWSQLKPVEQKDSRLSKYVLAPLAAFL